MQTAAEVEAEEKAEVEERSNMLNRYLVSGNTYQLITDAYEPGELVDECMGYSQL